MNHAQSPRVEAENAAATRALRWLEEHGDALYQFAIRRVRRAEIAEDIVQETLLAALSSECGFSGQSTERTWLVGILKHKLIDHLRKSFRDHPNKEMEIDASPEFFDSRGRWTIKVGARHGDPYLTLENAEFRQVLESCLSKLPARTAQLFWLREGEGLDSESACRELRISATNLWAMMHRARMGLRRCLSIHWFESGRK